MKADFAEDFASISTDEEGCVMSVDCDELLGLRDMSLELDSLMVMAGAVR